MYPNSGNNGLANSADCLFLPAENMGFRKKNLHNQSLMTYCFRSALRSLGRSSLALVLFWGLAFLPELQAADGKKLFETNCARCHYTSDKKLVGPGLAGVRQRWSSQDNLIAWIQNSAEYLKTGDKYAIDLYEKYNRAAMPAFTNLSKDDVLAILDYIDEAAKQVVADAGAAPQGEAKAEQKASPGVSTTIFLVVLILVLITLILYLTRVSRSLIAILQAQGAEVKKQEEISLSEKFENALKAVWKWAGTPGNRRWAGLIIVLFVLWLLKLAWDGLYNIGVFQGYQPQQPIKFSHAKHAGELKIACVYCHTGATQSKHATIPSPSTCMNCHMAVKEGPKYGKTEIAKIYASIGYNPNTDRFIENYTSMPYEEVSKIFAEWLEGTGNEYRSVEPFFQKPINWVQIHKLPDHAYFNHAQHYNVGQIECQTCHGPVQEMEEVYQYAPLTMGWCINCHRETPVKWEGNAYYARLHDFLKARYREGDKFTVSRIGGLECGKCHY